ncbi:MAG: hypothetical protein RRA92_07450 [Gemmatimonadota bacterium]|nr:hypothetical protein [Gemmatimonadota bacterium]
MPGFAAGLAATVLVSLLTAPPQDAEARVADGLRAAAPVPIDSCSP